MTVYNSDHTVDPLLRVTALAPGTNTLREVLCPESQVPDLVVYLSRRGYDDIRIFETRTITMQRNGGEVW